jgi:hypothetical protein
MKLLPLLPNRFKIAGWFLLVPFFGLSLMWLFYSKNFVDKLGWLEYSVEGSTYFIDGGNWLFGLRYNHFADEIIGLGLLLGLSLVAFAKTRIEDEWTTHLRLKAILWSIIINTLFTAASIIFIYNELFLNIMMVNLFSVLFLFIIRFEYLLWLERRQLKSVGA